MWQIIIWPDELRTETLLPAYIRACMCINKNMRLP